MEKAMMELLQRIGERLARPVFRRGVAMMVDAAIVIESFAVALLFRFWGFVPPGFWSTFWVFAVFAALAFVLLLYVSGVYQSGVYQSTLRYSGIYQDVQEGRRSSCLSGCSGWRVRPP
jgi:hypothetical protein